MTGGVLRGVAVQDVKAGDEVEIAVGVGARCEVRLAGTPAFECFRHAAHGRACAGKTLWRVDRRGDAVVSWACTAHLNSLVMDLQRPFEVTELVVTPSGNR